MARPLPTNKLVRNAIKSTKLQQYQVAQKLGYTEWTFSKLLRNELPNDEQKDLAKMILNLK